MLWALKLIPFRVNKKECGFLDMSGSYLMHSGGFGKVTTEKSIGGIFFM